ncbi:RING finger protein 145 [Trematomus bernacchii]|uniref:RING finger protein 145 n=1 Tax=Trematomus bernacchii TaxID=40690 RepID=UPI00146E5D2D|nr:RING finger protein 145 [Trematomus bernacchii]XP_034000404.1 RING finger protein 145 [Trematomus bernacchii]
MPRLEELANVALRVPSILVLDLLYKCDIEGLTEHLKAKNDDMLFKYKYVIWNMYYIGHLLNLVVLVLPLRHIVTLYLHILAALLLYMGHQISKDYVRDELQYGYEGAVYLDSLAFNRFVSAMTSQIILSTLCAFLMKSRKVWLFSAHLLPLLARLCFLRHATLLTVNTLSVGLTAAGITVFLLAHLFVPYRLAKAAYSELLQLEVIELYRLLAVGISLWNQFAVPVLFSVFWFVLFVVQLFSDTMSTKSSAAGLQGILFFLLTSVSECCATPYSLLGLAFVVSYLALGLLNLCKFYLGGHAAVLNENVMHRGVTEGVTLLLLALQTGLLDIQALQRTFLLSIILFIVATSTLQSMIEITDPIILALGASRNRSVWKHLRGISMCLLLLIFPVYMAYKISKFFHMDFWLLILVSSCMLTSLQVTGTMLIYSLFMVELFRRDPIESLDEVIYWVNAVSRVLEFVVALCVVAYGTWESLFGEWSWMGASVIIIHSYFNVWLRAQSGWKSFLLRQEAAKKINSLPLATAQQLQEHNDVCSICFQEMSSAVITYCGHFFHGNCLRKWLYVQETCPMCHQKVRPSPRERNTASGDAAEEEATPRDTGPDPSAQQEEDLNQDNGSLPEMQSDAVTPDPAEQQEEIKSVEDGDCAREDNDKQDETQREAVQGLRFSSSGDFVGFVSPCSSGGDAESHNTSLSNMHNEGEESGIDSPLPSTLERQSASYGAEREDSSSAFSPENRDLNKHNDCERTTRSCSLESNKNLEACGVNSQTSVKSSNKKSEFLDCVEDPENHKASSSCTRSEDSD